MAEASNKHVNALDEAKGRLSALFPNAWGAFLAVVLMLGCLMLVVLTGIFFEKVFLVERGLKLFSVPFIAFLYLARRHATASLLTPPSPIMLGWSLAGYFFALVASGGWAHYGLVLGTLTGLFFRLNPNTIVQHLRADSLTGFAITAGALSGPIFVIAQKYIWIPMSQCIASLMSLVLMPFYKSVDVVTRNQLVDGGGEYARIAKNLGNAGAKFDHKMTNFAMITTDGNTFLKFISTMYIGNGLSLMLVLLAMVAIFQPHILRAFSPVKTYGACMAFVVLGNVLWLSIMYLLLPPINNVQPESVSAQIKSLMAISTSPLMSWFGFLLLNSAGIVLLWFCASKPSRKALPPQSTDS